MNEIPKKFQASFHGNDFTENIVFAGDLNDVLSRLRSINPSFVIPGSEPGVTLADQISDNLKTPSNGLAKSRARRNKFEMIKTLNANGLLTAEQIKSNSTRQILDWAKRLGTWPVVIKPLESSGTDHVFICNSESEIKSACESIIGTLNPIGLPNDEALAQSFLNGEEFIVNTVSWNGRHLVSDVRHVHKIMVEGKGRIYDYIELLRPDTKIVSILSDYVFKVLNALDIHYGPGHSEVIITEKGPALVEIGARMDGVNVFRNTPSIRCLEKTQLELVVEAYANPDAFAERIGKPYRFLLPTWEVALVSKKDGVLKSLPRIDDVKRLPTFWDMSIKAQTGSKIDRTVDMSTCPGHVHLAHKDEKAISKDYQAIREMEKGDFYVMA
jgi:biotin carboxylase